MLPEITQIIKLLLPSDFINFEVSINTFLMKQGFKTAALLFSAIILLNSCFLRKKNKCMDCPKWGHYYEQSGKDQKVKS